MSVPTAEQVYQAVRELLPEMPDELQRQAKELLRRADGGEKTDNALLDLIAEHEPLKEKLRRRLFPGEEETRGSDAVMLPGDPQPGAPLFVCPRCGWIFELPKKGYPVPDCPNDGSKLQPKPQGNE